MTLQLADLPAGAVVDEEQAVQGDEGPGYDRSFNVVTTPFGGTRLALLDSEVDLAASAASARSHVQLAYATLQTKAGRAAVVRAFVKSLGKKAKKKDVKVGVPGAIQVGDGGFAIRLSVTRRGFRFQVLFASFSVDRAEALLTAASLPGGKIALADLTPLFVAQATRMHDVLFPPPPP
jgi:hypothetical protein